MKSETYICPCCGFNGLDVKPYKNIPNPPYPKNVTPPYSTHWGAASYDVCACCGFEYGHDDDPGIGKNEPIIPESFEDHLAAWVNEHNCKWFSPESKPKNWDLTQQLNTAGISAPSPKLLAPH